MKKNADKKCTVPCSVNRPNPATGGVLGAEAPIKEVSKRRWLPLTQLPAPSSR